VFTLSGNGAVVEILPDLRVLLEVNHDSRPLSVLIDYELNTLQGAPLDKKPNLTDLFVLHCCVASL